MPLRPATGVARGRSAIFPGLDLTSRLHVASCLSPSWTPKVAWISYPYGRWFRIFPDCLNQFHQEGSKTDQHENVGYIKERMKGCQVDGDPADGVGCHPGNDQSHEVGEGPEQRHDPDYPEYINEEMEKCRTLCV